MYQASAMTSSCVGLWFARLESNVQSAIERTYLARTEHVGSLTMVLGSRGCEVVC